MFLLCWFILAQVTTVYNKAIATSNTDIIVNSVVVLFVMEVDEWIFAGLEAWNENWTAHASDSVSSSDKEAKGDEVSDMKDEIAFQKAQIADQQEELKLQKDQLAKQNDEIAMLREAVQIMKESFGAASTSPESIPQCDAVEDLFSPSVESEDSACSDTGVGKTMDTMNDDKSPSTTFESNDFDTDGVASKERNQENEG